MKKLNNILLFVLGTILSVWICIDLTGSYTDVEKLYYNVVTRDINSTEALMKKIFARYHDTWFKKVAFSQVACQYENDSLVKAEIWDEEYRFPSKLLIYLTPGDTSNRYICRDDSVIVYTNNELTSARRATHDPIILSMDIYNMTYRQIMRRWRDLPYDTDKFHQVTRDGKTYHVVGAAEGDSTSNQVWFDAETLFFAKLKKETPRGFQEITFSDYTALPDGKGWIEQEVEFRLDGHVYTREKYFSIIPEKNFDHRGMIRRMYREAAGGN
jgi:hypothetical protein